MNAPRPDDLTERLTALFRSDEPSAADVAADAHRIAGHVTTAAARRRATSGRRAVIAAATGLAASACGVVGAGAAAAANPFTPYAAGLDGVAKALGVPWSSMPHGYTREQYDAFWKAGFLPDQVAELQELWHVDANAAKARAGQLVLDGDALPLEPGIRTMPVTDENAASAALTAYSTEQLEEIADLWEADYVETKIAVGRLLMTGQDVPDARPDAVAPAD